MGSVSSIMAAAMATIVATHTDSVAEAFTIVMLAGVIQIVLGSLRISNYIAHTPYTVIAGFTSGIGVMLVVSMLGSFLGNAIMVTQPVDAVRSWPDSLESVNAEALLIGLCALGVSLLWPKRLRKLVPSMLAGVVAATLLSLAWLSDVPTIEGVSSAWPQWQRPVMSLDFLAGAVVPALTIALVNSIDGLLWALALDVQTRTRLDTDRGLRSSGLGNVAAGLVGGLPGALSFIPSMLAYRMGARTRLSPVVRSLALLGLMLGLVSVFEHVPHAALAGVMAATGWQLIDWRFLVRMRHVKPEHLVIMLATLAITIFVDLVTAVAVGLIMAGMIGARQFQRLQLDSLVSVPLLDQAFLHGQNADTHDISPYSARTGIVKLRGSYTVASSSTLIRTIGDDIIGHEVVILDFAETDYVDDSAALVIEQLIDLARANDVHCIVLGLDGTVAATLASLNALHRVPDAHIVTSIDQARQLARRMLGIPPVEGAR